MDRLPEEMILHLCQFLRFQDCLRLLSTCVRFHDLIPAAMQRLSKTITLIIRDEGDFSRMDLVEKHDLFSHVGKIRLNVELLAREETSADILSRLKALTTVCPNVRALQLDFAAEIKTNEHPYYARRRLLEALNEWLGELGLKELHYGRVEEHACRDTIVVPVGVETCTISYNDLGTTFSADKSLQTSALTSIRHLHLVLHEMAFQMDTSLWSILARMPVLEELLLSGDAFCIKDEENGSPGNPASGVTLSVPRVKVDLRLTWHGLRSLLKRLTNVDTMFLDITRLIFDRYSPPRA